jgi:hypothetical protein
MSILIAIDVILEGLRIHLLDLDSIVVRRILLVLVIIERSLLGPLLLVCPVDLMNRSVAHLRCVEKVRVCGLLQVLLGRLGEVGSGLGDLHSLVLERSLVMDMAVFKDRLFDWGKSLLLFLVVLDCSPCLRVVVIPLILLSILSLCRLRCKSLVPRVVLL